MATYTKDEKTKKWMVRWREIGTDGEEHQTKKRGFGTKKEAEAWFYSHQKELEAAKEKAARGRNGEANPNGILFDELSESWLMSQKKRIKESSYYCLVSRMHSLITPAFSGKKMSEIRAVDILHWQESLVDRYSFETRDDAWRLLASIYRYGAKYYDIDNVILKVDKPRNNEPRKKVSVWTPEQFSQFIEKVEDPNYNLFFRMLYSLGCRRGELQALRWEDFDPTVPDVHICHTITIKTISGDPWAMTTPKTRGSDRKVRIPDSIAGELEARRSACHGRPEQFIFGGDRPFAEQTINRRFTDARIAADLPKIRVHDIRHSCASYLISRGVDIVTVSARLGHSSVKMTLDTYSHMMPKADDLAVKLLSEIV